jgi:hypothetical protein
MFAAEAKGFGPGLKHAGFVVSRHNTDEGGAFLLEVVGKPIEVHDAGGCDRDEAEAFFGPTAGRLEGGRMLDG